MGGYHFYQRIVNLGDALDCRESEVKKALKLASEGIAKPVKIAVHPSHIHYFADVSKGKERDFVVKVKASLSRIGVRWKPYHIMTETSLEKRYINRLLEETHKRPLI